MAASPLKASQCSSRGGDIGEASHDSWTIEPKNLEGRFEEMTSPPGIAGGLEGRPSEKSQRTSRGRKRGSPTSSSFPPALPLAPVARTYSSQQKLRKVSTRGSGSDRPPPAATEIASSTPPLSLGNLWRRVDEEALPSASRAGSREEPRGHSLLSDVRRSLGASSSSLTERRSSLSSQAVTERRLSSLSSQASPRRAMPSSGGKRSPARSKPGIPRRVSTGKSGVQPASREALKKPKKATPTARQTKISSGRRPAMVKKSGQVRKKPAAKKQAASKPLAKEQSIMKRGRPAAKQRPSRTTNR